tara:strand:- start:94 stop:747 length:654 start_codon:yes stop_codon:yes gene_type:complete
MPWLEKLAKNGFVICNNFLPYNEALQLRNEIIKRHHIKKWNLLTAPSQPLSRIKNNISTKVIDKSKHVQAIKALKRRRFSFSFYRSSNKHQQQHGQSLCHQTIGNKVIELLKSCDLIAGELQDSFFALFNKGQFISYHTDGGAGKYAFIYQLSIGWQERFGGQLELYPRKIKFYKRVITPKFNTLTILKLSHPMPHSVRLLNNPVYKHRITISGWVE